MISCLFAKFIMRYLLLLVLLGFCHCSDSDDYKYSAKYNDGVDNYEAFEEHDDSYNDWRKDEKYREPNVVGLEKNDREDIIRPCATDDRQCVRKFFAENANCKPSYGSNLEPLYFDRISFYFSYANVTAILTKVQVNGIATMKLIEFYVNKATGNLVLALDFKNLTMTSPNAYLRYKRIAKESIVLNDAVAVQYLTGTFTAVIPRVPHLRLDLAEVHADIDDPIPNFINGPRVVNTDPDVLTSFARLLSDIPTGVQEAFLFQSQLFTAIYIQKNICDFGLKLIGL